MTITLDLQPNCRATLHATIPADLVKQKRQTVLSNIAKVATMPGFRPGKVPMAVVAKRYKEHVSAELEQALINDGCREGVKREKKFESDDTFVFKANLLLAPELQLPEYKGIPAKLERVEVTDQDVEHDIFHLRERAASYDEVERSAATGDVLVLNYTAHVDGQPTAESMPDLPAVFKEMKGNWFQLNEAEDFVPGFSAGLVGINKGEKRTLALPVPEDFHNESLRGKTLELQVECEAVREKKMPELNDELATKFIPEGNVEKLKEEVRKAITFRKQKARDESLSEQVLKFLDEQMSFEVPQEMVDSEAQRRTNEITLRAARSGMDNDAIMGMQDQILGSATAQAQQSVKASFILAEVARKEGITVTDQQVLNAIANMAAQSGKQPKAVLQDLQKRNAVERVREDIMLQSAMRFLMEQANVEEVDATTTPHGCDFEKGEAA
jgi:trigger factor